MLRIAVLVSGGGTNLQAILMRSQQERSQTPRSQQLSVIIKMPMHWNVQNRQV